MPPVRRTIVCGDSRAGACSRRKVLSISIICAKQIKGLFLLTYYCHVLKGYGGSKPPPYDSFMYYDCVLPILFCLFSASAMDKMMKNSGVVMG